MAAEDSTQLPRGVHLDARHGVLRAQVQVHGIRRSKLLPRGATAVDAAEEADNIRKQILGMPDSRITSLLRQAKRRATKQGVSFILAADDVRTLYERAKGRCEVTGTRFSGEVRGRRKTRPFAPSIDRRDPRGPYQRSNCRIVCVATNVALFDWGEQVFAKLAANYISRHILAHPKCTPDTAYEA